MKTLRVHLAAYALLVANITFAANIAPVNSTLCQNASLDITVTGTGPYIWQYFDGGSWNNLTIVSPYDTTGHPETLHIGDAGSISYIQFRCLMNGVQSDICTLAILPVENYGSLSAGTETLCNPADPSNITMSVSPSGSADFAFQWYYQDGIVAAPTGTSTAGWTSIVSATNNNFDPPSGLTVSRTYALYITPGGSPTCGTPTWAAGAWQVTVMPVIDYGTIANGDETLCNPGDPSNITLSASPSGAASFTYQWYYQDGIVAAPVGSGTAGWTSIGSASNDNYLPPAGLSCSRTYALMVIPGGTPACPSAWANSDRQVTILTAINYGTLSNGNQTLCNPANPSNITLSTVASGGTGTFNYQWYSQGGLVTAPSGTSTTGWTSIAGATANSYDPPSGLTGSTTYALYIIPTGSPACASAWATGARQDSVMAVTDYGTLTSADETICNSGDPSNISMSVLPTGSGSFTFQWYSKNGIVAPPSGTSTATWNSIGGATGSSYDPPSGLTASKTYALYVTPGNTPTCGTSTWANGARQVTVLAAVNYGTLTNSDQNLCTPADPSNITMATLPSGSGSFSYQWYYQDGDISAPSGGNTTGWTLIAGANTDSYDPPSGLTGTRTYALLVTPGAAPLCGAATWASEVRHIYVWGGSATYGSLTSGNQTLCYSSDPSNITMATAPSGSWGYYYQWYYQDGIVPAPLSGSGTTGWTSIAGATNNNYNPPNGLTNSRTYALTVNPAGCDPTDWSSGARQVTILANMNYGTLNSGSETLCNPANPSNITMSSGPVGSTSFTFQWYSQSGIVSAPSGTSTAGWTLITGATSSNYDPPAGLTSSTTYALYVTPSGTPSCGTATWASGAWQVTVLPVINYGSLASGNESFCAPADPSNISMSSTPTGSGSFSYQWYYQDGIVPDPSGTSTAGWTSISGATINNFDPPSGLTGSRTYALYIIPGASPTCGTSTWATGSRKVTVNPLPVLTISPSDTNICNGSLTKLALKSNVALTTFTWTVTDPGSTGASAGSGDSIKQNLINNSNAPALATYNVTPKGPTPTSCIGLAGSAIVRVNPTPKLDTTIDAHKICNNTATGILLNTPTTLTNGSVTFSYYASGPASVTGFSTATVNGLTNGTRITDNLHNSSLEPQIVTYHITPKAGTTGCSDGITKDVAIKVAPTSVITSIDSAKWCNNTLTTYIIRSSSSTASFHWNRPLVGGIVNSAGSGTDSIISETLINARTYAIDVIYNVTPNVVGCDGTTKNVKVKVYSPILVNITPNPAEVCAGTNLSLNGNPTGGAVPYITHTWTGSASGFLIPNNTVNPVLNSPSAGSYALTYKVVDNNYCTATDSRNITIHALPDVTTVSNNGPVCIGNPLSLTCNYTGIGSYLWTRISAPANSEKNPAVTSSAGPSDAGSYSVTVTNEHLCNTIKSTTVVVNSLPDATASSSPVCTDLPLYLNGSTTSTVTPITYTWTKNGDNIGSGQNLLLSSDADISLNGVYTLTVKDNNQCSKTDTANVLVYPLPVAIASNNGPLCEKENLILTGGVNGLFSYSWNGPSFPAHSGQNQTIAGVTSANAGDYILTVTDVHSCSNKDTTSLVVNPLPGSQFDPLPKPSYSKTDDPATLFGNYSGGKFWGDGVVNTTQKFYPKIVIPGYHTLYYSYIIPSTGCTDTAKFTVYVGVDSAFISGFPESEIVCYDSDPILITAKNNGPLKGTLSGKGITLPDPVNHPDSAFFNPRNVYSDTVTISYKYLKKGSEYDISTKFISIDSIATPYFETKDQKKSFCSSGSVTFYAKNIYPAGGIHSWWGVPDSLFTAENDHVTLYTYKVPKGGIYNIKYQYKLPSGCKSDSVSEQIQIFTLPDVRIQGLRSNYDSALTKVALHGVPSGGTFTGSGLSVVDTFLNPSVSRMGLMNTLTYKYTDTIIRNNDTIGCSNEVTRTVGIISAKGVILGPDTICYAGDSIGFSVIASDRLALSTSTFSGRGVRKANNDLAKFDPKTAGIGTDTILFHYTGNDVDHTQFTVRKFVKVDIIDTIQIVGLKEKYCSNDGMQQISTTNTPPGGNASFTIPGSSKSNPNGFYDDGKTAHFFLDAIINNKLANYGEIIPLTFTYTSELKCTVHVNSSFVINEVPVAHIRFDGSCHDANLPVKFFDASKISSDTIITWEWGFGDLTLNDSISRLQNPSWKYSGTINATVTLKVSTFECTSAQIDTIIKVGDVLKAQFNWDDECYTDATPTKFTSKVNVPTNDKIKSYDWKFLRNGNIESTSSVASPTYQFTQLDSYDVRFKVVSDSGCVDSVWKKIDLRPWIHLSDSNYSETFNQSQDGWFSYAANDTDNNIWKLGAPDDATFKVPAGEKVWYTKVDSAVRNSHNQSTWVTGPCFDFSGVKKPMIKMDIIKAFDKNIDGGVMQFSLDKGITWNDLGAVDEGIKWYNSLIINGQPGGQQWGWTGTGTDIESFDKIWSTVRHNLDDVKNKPNVRFRIAYGLQANRSPITKGFAFDNIWIGESSKILLFEHFTNVSNLYSEDHLLDTEIKESPDDFLDIRYHFDYPSDDVFADAYLAGPATKALCYKLSGVPCTIIDGGYEDNSRIDYKNLYWDNNLVQKVISQRILEDPKFIFTELKSEKSSTGIKINIEIKAKEAINAGTTLHVAIVEKGVQLNGAVYKNVLRKLMPDPSGIYYPSWSAGQSEKIELSWDYANIANEDSLKVIAFIQNDNSKEIYQAASDEPGSLGKNVKSNKNDSVAPENSNFLIYPNPAIRVAYITFEKPLNEETVIRVYNELGVVVKTLKAMKGDALKVINTVELKPGLYVVKINGNNQYFMTQRLVVVKK